jgi:hypothetical protein
MKRCSVEGCPNTTSGPVDLLGGKGWTVDESGKYCCPEHNGKDEVMNRDQKAPVQMPPERVSSRVRHEYPQSASTETPLSEIEALREEGADIKASHRPAEENKLTNEDFPHPTTAAEARETVVNSNTVRESQAAAAPTARFDDSNKSPSIADKTGINTTAKPNANPTPTPPSTATKDENSSTTKATAPAKTGSDAPKPDTTPTKK